MHYDGAVGDCVSSREPPVASEAVPSDQPLVVAEPSAEDKELAEEKDEDGMSDTMKYGLIAGAIGVGVITVAIVYTRKT
jgi:hypothetical protein